MQSESSQEYRDRTMVLEAFADTIVPGEKRHPGDRAIAGADIGGGSVAAGAVEVLEHPSGGLAPALDSLVFELNRNAAEYARDHGLVLGKNGKLYDAKKGQTLPEGVPPMPLLTDEELKQFPEPTTLDVVPHYVARYWDLMALSDRQPAKVIGAEEDSAG